MSYFPPDWVIFQGFFLGESLTSCDGYDSMGANEYLTGGKIADKTKIYLWTWTENEEYEHSFHLRNLSWIFADRLCSKGGGSQRDEYE